MYMIDMLISIIIITIFISGQMIKEHLCALQEALEFETKLANRILHNSIGGPN